MKLLPKSPSQNHVRLSQARVVTGMSDEEKLRTCLSSLEKRKLLLEKGKWKRRC